MANHRCFSKAVIDTDNFLDLPLSAQALYFHFGLNADDDGFVGNPRKTARSVGCTADDIKLLVSKGYLIAFDSGVVAISHWKQHNHIPKDRYHATVFEAEKAALAADYDKPCAAEQPDNDDNSYTDPYTNLYTDCIQTVDNLNTEVKLSKDKLSKDKISEDKLSDKQSSLSACADAHRDIDCQNIIDIFNSVCTSLPKVQKLTDMRKRKIRALVKALDGVMSAEEYFKKIEDSDFLSGRSGRWQACCFDWVVKSENIAKIAEGNYDNKEVYDVPPTIRAALMRPQQAVRGRASPQPGTSYDIYELNKINTLDDIVV